MIELLTMLWMKEVTPGTGQTHTLAARITATTSFPSDQGSFMLNLEVQPTAAKQGRVAISFLPENGVQPSCELQIEPGALRAQFATA